MTSLSECVAYLDDVLATSQVPDYERALNGLQLANQGAVTRIAAAVDFSYRSVQQAVQVGADLLLVHHGMFWGGLRSIVASRYDRLCLAITNDLAVYASHLPLDLHARLGNNAQLAHYLDLNPQGQFGRFQSIKIGVSGTADLATDEIFARVKAFADPLGTHVVCTPHVPERRTRHWAIITGAGASSDTIAEAVEHGIDTLIVGEGPHHTAVEALELDLVIIYAGHYATETLGISALADELGRAYSLPCSFVHLPTGL